VKHLSYGALHTHRQTGGQTDRQSDMVFIFLRMRLLASPFGLAIKLVRQGKQLRRLVGRVPNARALAES
jgi:hypothetical protein